MTLIWLIIWLVANTIGDPCAAAVEPPSTSGPGRCCWRLRSTSTRQHVPPNPGGRVEGARLTLASVSSMAGMRDVILRDGSAMRLASPTSGDGDAMFELCRRLSTESRYSRFRGIPVLDEHLVERYLDADGHNRAALIGTREGDVVALGTFRSVARPHIRRGGVHRGRSPAGSRRWDALLEQLTELAAQAGIRRFVAEVSPDNRRMFEVFPGCRLRGHPQARAGNGRAQLPDRSHGVVSGARGRARSRRGGRSPAPFFRPRNVAVLGASSGRSTATPWYATCSAHFGGAIYPVNLRAEPVAGIPRTRIGRPAPCVGRSGRDCVPAARVVAAAEQVLEAGVRALCVISAGFAEVGDEGRRRQDDLLEACGSMARLLGPNCLGLAVPGAHLNATFAPHTFPPGAIGFSSQSGALGLALLERVAERGLGLSAFIWVGNKADISTNDLLEYWEDDEATRLVLLYVESFGNPAGSAGSLVASPQKASAGHEERHQPIGGSHRRIAHCRNGRLGRPRWRRCSASQGWCAWKHWARCLISPRC